MPSTPDNRPWWVRWPEIQGEIFSGLRKNGWSITGETRTVEKHSLELRLEGLVDPPGWLTITFGPATPTAVPVVVGPKTLGEHQHPIDGNLCLPLDATDAVKAVRAAIELYQDPERHRPRAAEPRSGYLPGLSEDAILLPLVLPDGDWGAFTLCVRATSKRLWGWVDSVAVGRGTHQDQLVVEADPALRDALRDLEPNLPKWRGTWVRTRDRRYPLHGSELMKLWSSEASPEAVRAAAKLDSARAGAGLRGLVVPEEGPDPGSWGERLIVLGGPKRKKAVVLTEPLTLSATRLPGLEELSSRTVAVAGVGMIGATVAMHLARSGLGHLRLADPDVVEVGNLVRQPYDLRDVGTYKTDALRHRVLRSAPWCSVYSAHLIRDRIERLRPVQLRAWLDGCDLLVAATANKQAELYLSRFAKDSNVPMVGGWVGFGIWGGFAYATRWGQSVCRACIEKRYGELVKLPEPDGAEEIYVAGCGHPTFPGSAIDGTTVSDVIARLALSILSPAYPAPPGDVGTIGIRNADEGGVVTVDWKAVAPSSDCTICS